MMAEADKAALLAAVKDVSGVQDSKYPGVLVEQSDGTLTLTATDLDTWVSSSVAAEARGDDAVVVSRDRLSKALMAMPEGMVSIAGDLTLGSGGDSLTLRSVPADGFPSSPPTFGRPTTVEDLPRMASRAVRFCGNDPSKLATMGVQLDVNDRVVLSAADAVQVAVITGEGRGDVSALVPKAAMQSISRMDGPVEVSSSGSMLKATCLGTTLVTRLVEARFPNVDVLFPRRQPSATASVDVDALAEALRMVGVVCQGGMRMEIAGGTLLLDASSPEMGDAHVEVPALTEGHCVVGADPRRIAKAASGGVCRVVMYGEMAPIVTECEGERHVVMPMRL